MNWINLNKILLRKKESHSFKGKWKLPALLFIKLCYKIKKIILKIKRVDYEYNEDDDEFIYLKVHVFKHMDSSLINVDIQTNYIRVTLKGKSLQLALSEEIMPDSSTAQRSQTTGQLVIKMPKLNKVIRPVKQEVNTSKTLESKNEEAIKKPSNYLEVDESKYKNRIDLANIVSDNEKSSKQYLKYKKSLIKERDNSPDFVDSSDVPPLS